MKMITAAATAAATVALAGCGATTAYTPAVSRPAAARIATTCKVGYSTLIGNAFKFTRTAVPGNSRGEFQVTVTDSGAPATLTGLAITTFLHGYVVTTQDTGPAGGPDPMPYLITPGQTATYGVLISELGGQVYVSAADYKQLTCVAFAQRS